jgi:hypothetical protein
MIDMLRAGLLAGILIGPAGAAAQTPADAYRRGCAGCHDSENPILRRMRARPEPQRRAFIEAFMAQHPCERDDLKPLIVDHLLERARR